MSTKLNNEHLKLIINECKEYKILDVYIILAYVSNEVKSGRYLIQTYTDKKSDLINVVLKYAKSAAYKTVSNCIDKLESLGILVYDMSLCAWSLKGMENMTKAKADAESLDEAAKYTGYTNIRKIFLSDVFFNMKAREKRLVIFICQLLDSKASVNYNNISVNLLKYDNSWLKVLKTKCKYYAKKTIETMLNKYKDIFSDFTSSTREKDLAPKSISNFKFTFKSDELNMKDSEDDMFELIKIKNVKEYNLIVDKAKFANITLSKQKIMHLVRAISTVKEWFLKERVVQLIINKYIAIQIHHSRENIHSLPNYAAAVVKAVVNEYNAFKQVYNASNVQQQVENYYDYYIEENSSSKNYDVINDISNLLREFKAV